MGGDRDTLDLGVKLRPRPDTTLVKVEDEAVVYQHDDGPLHGINQTGVLVWERLDGERSLAALIHELAARFGCPPQQVTEDVVGYAAHLIDRGLLEPVAEPEP